MRKIDLNIVVDAVTNLCASANFQIPEDIMEKLKKAQEEEISSVGKDILSQIIENDNIARKENVPMCQDTGLAVIFLELGKDVHYDGDIYKAIQEGVRRGYEKNYLRKSIVKDPFDRINTKDNTPAIIHTKIVQGNKIKIVLAPKGGGSENMSAVVMLKPSDGIEGVKKFVVDFVEKAGGNPCPPIIVGIGLGGNLEKSALLSKEALLRPINDTNKDEKYAKLEKDLLNSINNLGLGPMGLGGRTTALAVKVEVHPCHIAQLPLAININCHASRHKEVII